MLSLRLLLACCCASVPALAQFAIRVDQGGHSSSVANGGTVSFNAPAVGQSLTATVTVTYLGAATATFAGAPQIFSSGDFSSTGFGQSILAPFQSASGTIRYTPLSATLSVGQFNWISDQGTVTLTLNGTVPGLVVSVISSTGNSTSVPSGGTIAYPDTVVNSITDLTIAVDNQGSGVGTMNAVTASGDSYQVLGLPFLPATIAPGGEVRFVARFRPTSAGHKTGSLQISFGNGLYSATLDGTALTSLFTYQLVKDGVVTPIVPNQAIALGDTPVGDVSSFQIRIQSAVTAPVVLSTIAISGAGFVITDQPFLPATFQPQETKSITITFAPTQPSALPGHLLIGNDTFELDARAVGPQLRYSYQVGSVTIPINTQALISFPTVSVGQTGSVQFIITNRGTGADPLVSVGVLDTKGIFRLRGLPALPAQIAPNSSVSFAIDFVPQAAGLATSTLIVDGQSFALSGFSSVPPALPAYQFTGASGQQAPFTQPALGLSLDAPYPVDVEGILTLTVMSENFATDPAVQFSSGGRVVAFTIPANTRDAIFPSGVNRIQIQTGTAAATIVITPNFAAGSGYDLTPVNPTPLQFEVQRAAPVLLAGSISARSTTSISVLVTGYSTTRALDHLDFDFKGDGSVAFTGSHVTVSVQTQAGLWFQSVASQLLGGQFNVEVPFTLRSDNTGTDLSTTIRTITVTATNEVGVSSSVDIAVP
jgi:hypothetical protein